MSWSKIPMPLRIAALSTIALAGVQLALQPFSSLAFESRAWMFRSGLAYTAKCFAIFGAIELATLLHKRAAIGAKLAAAGWASTIVFGFIQIGISMADAWKIRSR